MQQRCEITHHDALTKVYDTSLIKPTLAIQYCPIDGLMVTDLIMSRYQIQFGNACKRSSASGVWNCQAELEKHALPS